jgi:hypothetical protein
MPPSIQEEIARFKQGTVKFIDLSEEAQIALKLEWQTERLGFEPDFLFRASGVITGGRPQVLAKAKRLITSPTKTIPVRVEHEVNKWDEYALAIYIPTLLDDFGEYQAWEQAGYVPRGRCFKCGTTLTGPMLDSKDECKNCGHTTYVRDDTGKRTLIDERTELNKYIFRLMNDNKIQFGLDNILADPNKPDLNTGLSIAVRIL